MIHETFFSLATVSSDYPLRLNSLKGSIYYFNNNIWYKYTGITWQKDKHVMADKKLGIPRKLKTETLKQLKIRTDMNSDAPYESVVRTSLIPLHGRKSWQQLPFLLLKIDGGGGKIVPPPFSAWNLRKKTLFYFNMEAYIVHLAKGIRIFGQGYALKP